MVSSSLQVTLNLFCNEKEKVKRERKKGQKRKISRFLEGRMEGGGSDLVLC